MASVNVRQKIAVAFYSLIETQAAEVGKAIEHRLRPFLKESETLPDVVLVLVLIGRRTPWASSSSSTRRASRS